MSDRNTQRPPHGYNFHAPIPTLRFDRIGSGPDGLGDQV
jgi:hypothetical protein